MGLFNTSKKKKDTSSKAEEKAVVSEKVTPPARLAEASSKRAGGKKKDSETTSTNAYSFMISNPRITEKATVLGANSVYTFDIPKSVTKIDVKKAIQELYNVIPTKIRVAPVPSKNVFIRGKKGVKSGGKKAMVYLKKGDKIEFV
ncbi:50S ribosomal protein L23 [Candidatus Wolfebacteria bacterium]|nr:MAG: 50S ribosomal protein L23 [Candidatus Wolfebacteria bacterium]